MITVILQNRLYIGEVVHKGQSYPGQHEAIIAVELFEQVQQSIAGSRVKQRIGSRAAMPSLLAGLLSDGHGRRMTPSHAAKQGKRYRYYVSQVDGETARTNPVWRMPAAEIERLVTAEVKAAIRQAQQRTISSGRLSGDAIEVLEDRCSTVVTSLDQDAPAKVREQLLALLERIDVGEGSLSITLQLDNIDPQLGSEPVTREIAIGFVRTSRQVKIVIPPPADHEQAPSPSLLKLVAQAFAAQAEMDKGGSFDAVASRLGYGGQMIYVVPDLALTVVMTSDPSRARDSGHIAALHALLSDGIVPAAVGGA